MAFLKFVALFALIALAAAQPTSLKDDCRDEASQVSHGADDARQVFQDQGDSGVGGGLQKAASIGAGFEKNVGGDSGVGFGTGTGWADGAKKIAGAGIKAGVSGAGSTGSFFKH